MQSLEELTQIFTPQVQRNAFIELRRLGRRWSLGPARECEGGVARERMASIRVTVLSGGGIMSEGPRRRPRACRQVISR